MFNEGLHNAISLAITGLIRPLPEVPVAVGDLEAKPDDLPLSLAPDQNPGPQQSAEAMTPDSSTAALPSPANGTTADVGQPQVTPLGICPSDCRCKCHRDGIRSRCLSIVDSRDIEVQTFRTIDLQISQGMWEAARESVEERIIVLEEEMETSPWERETSFDMWFYEKYTKEELVALRGGIELERDDVCFAAIESFGNESSPRQASDARQEPWKGHG
ncbi:hypothetical protein GGTG_12311 [Gaeumannomyces tritici R3-111a-1]|uniref:Uncharacterized protein n=1 Tax=Gaeumannomyces tritici (strain R3-111a-1) TaxID=644352 RepID=J3PFN6_GAET3|nr:hypothetical protein GGTG_12311 [Gaeumannomyces tritici R3-111a-1]EJT70138.1 hypothetical protein GGTG_12311 [Gaeumannomyces tritici R3-111a-1]